MLPSRTLWSVRGHHEPTAQAGITLTRARFLSVLVRRDDPRGRDPEREVKLEGDGSALASVFDNLDTFESGFGVVEP